MRVGSVAFSPTPRFSRSILLLRVGSSDRPWPWWHSLRCSTASPPDCYLAHFNRIARITRPATALYKVFRPDYIVCSLEHENAIFNEIAHFPFFFSQNITRRYLSQIKFYPRNSLPLSLVTRYVNAEITPREHEYFINSRELFVDQRFILHSAKTKSTKRITISRR